MNIIAEAMIAPCGVNCSVCIGYMREKKKCPGCMSNCEEEKPYHCTRCSIKYCDEHEHLNFKYCFECSKFPCRKMKNLDKRYITKYNTSLISNLKFIKNYGIDEFIKTENDKWICKICGEKLCVHRDFCLTCKTAYR